MIVFDADVLTDILRGKLAAVDRARKVPLAEQAVPIVVAEEILRGRLNAIRQADGRKLHLSVPAAYELLRESLSDFQKLTILPFNDQAEALVEHWRERRIRVGTRDLRIAAIVVAHGTWLVSRNRRDFDQIPGLIVDYWT